jgi:glutathione synthase/RimK-type ligase-like ATP-grasp enzyme
VTKVLILTNPTDEHLFAFREALIAKGAEVVLWHTSDLPSLQTASARFTRSRRSWRLRGPELDLSDFQPDVVVRRRPMPSVLPPGLHAADLSFAARECQSFSSGFQKLVAPDAFWVNRPEAGRSASLKVFQHQIALEAGLDLPDTLYSNDPAEIRDFVSAAPSGVIYKTIDRPGAWGMGSAGLALSYTSSVTLDELGDDEMLLAVPGIYQHTVPKAYELRVMVIGHVVLAAKIFSQETGRGRLDWRKAYDELRLEPEELPRSLAQTCRALLDRLGLVFGALDFIVTPEGRAVFLEINEMGQFLWVEEMAGVPLLDAFTEMLIQARPDFEWSASSVSVRAAAIWDRVTEALKAAKTLHASIPNRVEDELLLAEEELKDAQAAAVEPSHPGTSGSLN